MSIEQRLLQEILDAGKAAGMDQRTLAMRAGVAPETISRAKKHGNLELATLVSLASASGKTLCLSPTAPNEPEPDRRRSSLADPAWGLAWSNSNASDEVLVRNALLKGSFLVVLEAVLEHGLDFVRAQWALMLRDEERPSRQVQANIARILSNIERGLAHAQA